MTSKLITTTQAYSPDEWAHILAQATAHLRTNAAFAAMDESARLAYLASLSRRNTVRLALGLPPRKNGGIRPGGFEPNNKHNPKAKRKDEA